MAGLPVRRRMGGCVAAAERIPLSACATLLDAFVVISMFSELFRPGRGPVVVLSLSPALRAVTIRKKAQERHRIKIGGEAMRAPQPGAGSGRAGGRAEGL